MIHINFKPNKMIVFQSNKIIVKALWFDPITNYIGALLIDGTPVMLCSKEKWDLGKKDSLRKDWNENFKIWPKQKTFHYGYSVNELKKGGLKGMIVPDQIKNLIKKLN